LTDVARNHRPGHIGSTPQDTDTIVAGSRFAGELADYGSRFQPPEASRIDANLARPDVAADPGYFRDDTMLLQITGAAARMQPTVMRKGLDPKTFGDFDPAAPDG
jgi:hypothetical protein